MPNLQKMCNDSIKKSSTLSFHSWSTDRKTVDTLLQNQVDIGSAQNNNSPKYLIVAHQTTLRIGAPNKTENIAIFDDLNVRKYHVGIDGVKYPRDGVGFDYNSYDYVDQYRDLKLLYKEYVGKELLNSFISYTDMKNKHLIKVIELRFQVDHFDPKKSQILEEYKGATNNARLFMILIRDREKNDI